MIAVHDLIHLHIHTVSQWCKRVIIVLFSLAGQPPGTPERPSAVYQTRMTALRHRCAYIDIICICLVDLQGSLIKGQQISGMLKCEHVLVSIKSVQPVVIPVTQPACLLNFPRRYSSANITDLRMASGDISKDQTKDASTLMEIAAKAAGDLRSQAGRLASDLTLARNFGQTLLSNGIINDRSYLVRNSV